MSPTSWVSQRSRRSNAPPSAGYIFVSSAEGDGAWIMEINTGRVTAELEGGLVVYAQRY